MAVKRISKPVKQAQSLSSGNGGELLKSLSQTYFHWRLGSRARKRLYRKLSFRMKQGMKAQEAVHSIFADLVSSRAKTPEKREKETAALKKTRLAKLLSAVELKLRNKGRLSVAMDGWVPEADLLMIRAGDESNTLPETLSDLNDMNDAIGKVTRNTVMAIIVPLGLLLFSLGLIYAFALKIGPVIRDLTSKGADLTLSQNMILAASDFMNDWWLACAITLIAIPTIVLGTLHMHWGKLEPLRIELDKYPPWSLYRKLLGIRLLASMSLLLKGQKTQVIVDKIIQNTKNGWLKHRLQKTYPYLRDGANLGQAFKSTQLDFPDPEVIDDLVTLSEGEDSDLTVRVVYNEWLTHIDEEIKLQTGVILRAAALILAISAIIMFSALQDAMDFATAAGGL